MSHQSHCLSQKSCERVKCRAELRRVTAQTPEQSGRVE